MKNKVLLLIHSLVLFIVLCLLVQGYQTPEERMLEKIYGVYEIGGDLQTNNSVLYPGTHKNTRMGFKVILSEEIFAEEYPLPPNAYMSPCFGQYIAFPTL